MPPATTAALLCLMLSLAASASAQAPRQPADGPQALEDRDFAGRLWVWRREYFVGEPYTLDLQQADMGRLMPLPAELGDLDLDNRVASLRWHLPSGTLVTFYEDADGSGREFSIDSARGRNPSVQDLKIWGPARAWRWTRPHPAAGRFVLYAEPDMKGERIVRALDGHAPDLLHPLDRTKIDHRLDSLSWALPAGVTVTLYSNADGTGSPRVIGPGSGRLRQLDEVPDRTFAEAWSWHRETGDGAWLLQPDGDRGLPQFELAGVPEAALQTLEPSDPPAYGARVSWTLPENVLVMHYAEPYRGGQAWVLAGDGASGPRITPVGWEWRRGDLCQDLADRQRSYDDNTWLVARAADASIAAGWSGVWHQADTLDELLEGGVRGLELQAVQRHGELLLVRDGWEWSVRVGRGRQGCQPLSAALAVIASFLENNPRDVLTLFLDDADPDGPGRLDPSLLALAFAEAGLAHTLFDGDAIARSTPARRWPTVAQLAASGRRLVLFRGPADDSLDRARPLTWRPAADDLYRLGEAGIATRLDARLLRADLDTWMATGNGRPTFIAVDFATLGERGGPRRLVRELNAERSGAQ